MKHIYKLLGAAFILALYVGSLTDWQHTTAIAVVTLLAIKMNEKL